MLNVNGDSESLILYKVCSKCMIKQPIDEFTRNNSRKDGRACYCRTCRAKYRVDAKDVINATKRRYYRTYSKKPGVRESLRYKGALAYFVKHLHTKRNDDTIEFLGCTASVLVNHLQKSAEDNGYVGFDIYEYDSNIYHLDHIKPFKLYIDGEATLSEICNYKNVQILKQMDNLIKGASYNDQYSVKRE